MKNKVKKISKINSIIFFVIWIIIMLLGADKPPPKGFLIVVFILYIQSAILEIYSNFLIPKLINKEKNLFLKNTMYWSLFGSITWFILSIFPNLLFREKINIYFNLILFLVILIISIINSFIYYFFNKIIIKNNKNFI
ncbi:hypothetical protein OSSY52_16470 [Tepiditoga spiralis]|uniref:Uncharacterized protein n=1 Tax=Tepiditoga spiralis TaxID=2108365 RepID=A0A7G1G7Z2_9BACT|nr:hypothetical protein [Tepiditoga spiralis]BBE31506.1 hypothetical protein OSSY52_16470 [Tepiditoga spiralis]